MGASLKSVLKSGKNKDGWLQKIRNLKKDQLLILLLTGVLLLVIALPTGGGGEEDAQETEDTDTVDADTDYVIAASYEERLEARLKSVLETVDGIGSVEVMITLASSSEKIVEKDKTGSNQSVSEADSSGGTRTTQDSEYTESTVYSENEDPYVVKELEPEVEGVLVVAEGGGDAVIKQEISEAVQALFGVEAHKIKIMKMEGSR